MVSFSSSGISLNPKCVVRALLLEASGVIGLGFGLDDDEACLAAIPAGADLAWARVRAPLLSNRRPDILVYFYGKVKGRPKLEA